VFAVLRRPGSLVDGHPSGNSTNGRGGELGGGEH